MKRTWLLEPLKDRITAQDQFVCRDSDGLKLSPFASAMIGQPLPDGWIAFREMRNQPRRKRGFNLAWFKTGWLKKIMGKIPDLTAAECGA